MTNRHNLASNQTPVGCLDIPLVRPNRRRLVRITIPLLCGALTYNLLTQSWDRQSITERSLDVEQLPASKHESILAWENTTWIGNLFVPPPGAKLYSPADIRRILSQESILIVGDSTGRRLWATIWKLLNVTNKPDDSTLPIHISKEVAYRDYETDRKYRKMKKGGPSPTCPKWAVDPVVFNGSRHGSFCLDNSETGRSIDFLGLHSYWLVEHFAKQSSNPSGMLWNATQQYSLIITAVGIWENIRPDDCVWNDTSAIQYLSTNDTSNVPYSSTNYTSKMRLRSLISSLDELVLSRRSNNKELIINNNFTNLTSPDLSVIWRTSGYHENPNTSNVTDEHNRLSIDLVKSKNNKGLTYLDWGTAVRPRSFGSDRIVGDSYSHYGAEARLLMVQMLANALDKGRGSQQSV